VDGGRRDINKLEFNYATASEFLGISERKMHQLVEERKITCVKVGLEVRFRQIDLDQYVLGCVRPLRPEHQLRLGVPPGVGTS